MDLANFILDHFKEIIILLLEHIRIVVFSVSISIITGVGIGLWITQHDRVARLVLYVAGVAMTIPSVAMFGLLIPVLSRPPICHGIGLVPAVVALVLYAQLPVIRNTYVSMKSIDPAVIETARGLGMTRFQILRGIEFPLAVPVIMAGIRTSVVMNIGIAAIAAYIGAGGLGEYIFRGIATTYRPMILAGSIFVSMLALGADLLLGKLEKMLTPRGLRI